MENNRLYIVSFGDSRDYRLPVECAADGESTVLTQMERELNDYLRKEFAESNFKYFTVPKVTEVSWSDRDKYSSYPLLDEKALSDLKKVLRTEVMEMDNVRQLNSDAPYSNV